ncbi:MAG: pilus assembly protein [Clostridiales bacterium]|nr:pilus assembly protein [Clostridiales bacterium]
MLKSLQLLRKDNCGQAVAELAITLPILLLILCSIIDFGWFFSNQLTLSYLSREGARFGMVNSEGATAISDIKNRVLNVAPEYLRDKMTVTVTFSNSTQHRSGDIDVSVQAGVLALTPVVGIFTQGDTVTLSSKCVMKVE